MSSFSNVLLVDSLVHGHQTFVDSVNENTFPVVFDCNTTKSSILSLLQEHFTKIDRIGIVFEGQPSYLFLDNQPLFIPNEITPFSENVQFIIEIIRSFNVQNIDYLGCNTLNLPNWKSYYDIIQTNTNAIVGASNDMTGNIQYGGDWIMESTGTNIESIYFTNRIEYYKYLLGSTSSSTIVISDDFKIYGCGENSYDQLGIYDKSALTPIILTGKTPKSISCGERHTIVLMTDGSIYGCGNNVSGQLGDGTTTDRITLTPMTIPTGKTPLLVSCGAYHTIVLMTDGSVYGCGRNLYGQLGDNSNTNRTTLTPMTNTTGKTPVLVSCGTEHTIVLVTDGSIYGCGYNGYGQLGNGTTTDRSTLTQMTNTTGKTPLLVSCGAYHTIVLMTDGSIYGCGFNYFGQLGDGTTTDKTTLTQITNNTGKTPVLVSCRGSHTIVLMTDGSIYGCGGNNNGQLGDGTTVNKSTLTPMTNTTGKTPLLVTCGAVHTIVLMTDGSVYGCGYNSSGRLGDGTNVNKSTLTPMTIPTGKTPVLVSCGGSHTIVLITDGSIYGCGYNGEGQLGDGTTTDKSTLTPMTTLPQITKIPTGKTPLLVSCGGNNHTIVLMTDGSIYGCGYNSNGQLGDGTTVNKSTLTPMTNNTGKTPASVSCGAYHTIVLMTDGSIYGCGYNPSGQLGNGTTTDKNTLTQITNNTGKTPKSISCGGYHTIVLMTDGSIYVCGYNGYGQLGDNSNTNKSTLTPMTNTTGKTPLLVSCGYNHTIVLMTDGSIYGCGLNINGQLGNGTTTDRSTLTPMTNNTGKTTKSVICGAYHTIVLMTDGSIYGCGNNGSGQLGDGTTVNKSTLTPMTNNTGKTPKSISCGSGHTIVLMTDGSVYGCGNNSNGQLGDGTTTRRNNLTPMTNTTGKTPVLVSCSNYTIVLMTDGSVYGCGLNNSGQLGDGTNTDKNTIGNPTQASISCGGNHTIVLMTDGSIYGCGNNGSGQLGNGTTTDKSTLTPMTNTTGKTPKSISCGSGHTIVLMTDGSIYGCGGNNNGQLGDGTTTRRNTLVQMTNNTGKTPLLVSCGDYHTIVLMTDGSIYVCGYNAFGQLGDGTTDKTTLTPMTNTTGKTPVLVSCGAVHTIVLMTDGSAYGCGYNGEGQLGDGTTTDRSTLTPMTNTTGKTPLLVSCGDNHTIVLMTDGSIYGCGYNSNGQLGDGTTTDKSTLTPMTNNTGKTPKSVTCGGSHTIVLMTDGSLYGCGNNFYGQLDDGTLVDKSTLTPMTNTTGKTPVLVSCGGNYTIVLMTDGSIYGCGYNAFGQLGIYDKSTLTQMTNTTGKTPVLVSCGGNYTIVLMTDGSIYGCGYNAFGQLGDGTNVNKSTLTPMTIPTGKTPVLVSCSNYTIVLMTDGSIYGCGNNFYGQLGDGTTTNRTTLTQMTNTTGKTPKSVSCGGYHTIVLMTDGSVYGCGNNNGQLGDGTFDNKTTLTQMTNTTGKTPKSISCGESHTIVLMTDGSIYGCGYNSNGQLGVGTLVDKSTLTPMTIPTGKTPKSVSCGYYHTIVLMTDGSAYGCGNNDNGQLGDTTYSNRTTLTKITNNTGKTPKSVSCGDSHTIVLMTDGSAYGCGYNGSGQLGDGTFVNKRTLTPMTNINKNFIVLEGNFIFFPSYFSLNSNIETFYPTTYSTYSLNTVPMFYYIYNFSIFQNTTLYMHGTRTSSNYLINGDDIGRFFQVDNFTKAIDLGEYNIAIANSTWGGQQSTIFSSARWIWNVAGAISGAPANVYLWFYYTFYYSSASNTGKINVICDSNANVYFNGVDKGAANSGWGQNSVGNEKTITIVNGLNYIRIAAYNYGTVSNSAGLLVTVRDSAGNTIANSNSDWAFSVSTNNTYNSGSLTYNAS